MGRNAVEDRVRAEQVQVLARNLPFTTLTGMAIAALAAAGTADTVGTWIWNWVAAFALVALLRLGSLRLYWKAAGRDARPAFWGVFLTVNTLVSGLMWLVFGLIGFVPDNPAHALFVAIIQTGLTAASLASLSCYLPAQMAFALPTMAGIILPFAISGERTLVLLSVMAVVFLVVIFLSGRRAEAVLVQSIRLRFDNQRLIEDLQRAKSEAEAASRAKSDFLAVMSHEIRTPMNGVAAMAELLGQTRTDSEQGSMVSILRQSAESMLTIIDDILDFSKIEAGRLVLENVRFDPARVIEDVAQVVAPRAAEKGLEVVVDLDPLLPGSVHGDPARLRQVLLNLAGNAVKFTERGHVRLCATPTPDNLLFAVEDTGIGIAPPLHANLFAPFTQADGSVARRYGGSGLGLSICKRLLELMGGRIWLDSAPGRGSRFAFTLPAPSGGLPARPPVLAGIKVTVRADQPLGAALERSLAARGALLVTQDADVTVRDGPAYSPANGATVTLVPFHHLDSGAGAGTCLRKPVRSEDLIRAVAGAAGRPSVMPPARPGELAYVAPSGAVADAEGTRILVAEDSAVNRMVVSKMLDRLGMVYDMAQDGGEALSLFLLRPYGLLLTDFHMPGMDGVTLARTIRAGRAGARLPIIALTADVLPETAALCASVGMQGYLTKPVPLPVLEDMLARHLPRAMELRRPAPDLAMASPETRPPSQILDTAHLSEIFGSLDAEALTLLDDFHASTKTRLSDLLATLAEGDTIVARRHAHTARGAARSVGANALADAFGAIDDTLAEGNTALADRLAYQAAKQLDLFRELLAELKMQPAAAGDD